MSIHNIRHMNNLVFIINYLSRFQSSDFMRIEISIFVNPIKLLISTDEGNSNRWKEQLTAHTYSIK